MFIIENFLEEDIILNLKKIIDNEIANSLCLTSPVYQSYNNMHLKYKDNTDLTLFLEKIKKNIEQHLTINECWFNICRKDSKFDFHNHSSPFTAVYFLEGCENNGTLFKINNVILQLKSKDNSVLFFEPSIYHCIPGWDNKDRYSIAVDFKL